jgi:hypothetical protein
MSLSRDLEGGAAPFDPRRGKRQRERQRCAVTKSPRCQT